MSRLWGLAPNVPVCARPGWKALVGRADGVVGGVKFCGAEPAALGCAYSEVGLALFSGVYNSPARKATVLNALGRKACGVYSRADPWLFF